MAVTAHRLVSLSTTWRQGKKALVTATATILLIVTAGNILSFPRGGRLRKGIHETGERTVQKISQLSCELIKLNLTLLEGLPDVALSDGSKLDGSKFNGSCWKNENPGKLEDELRVVSISFATPDFAKYMREFETILNIPYEKDKDTWEKRAPLIGGMAPSVTKLDGTNGMIVVTRMYYNTFPCYEPCAPEMSWLLAEYYEPADGSSTPAFHTVTKVLPMGANATIKLPSILPVKFENLGQVSGPEDPRIIAYRRIVSLTETEQSILVVFNLLYPDRKRRMTIMDVATGHQVPLRIEGEEERPMEKNWTPFFGPDGTTLHFAYNYNQAQIIRCSIETGICNRLEDSSLQKSGNILRGGTPLLRHENGNFLFAFARTTTSCNEYTHFYRPNFVLLHDETPRFPVIYASDPYTFENLLFQPPVKDIDDDVLLRKYARIVTAAGLVEWSNGEDLYVVSVNVNDNSSHLVLIKGLLAFISRVEQAYLASREFWTSDIREKVHRNTIPCAEAAGLAYCDSLSIAELRTIMHPNSG
ncbi:hypothetical protein HKX48_007221 [Thoreauomyces humboldtii]|nr:hypothetical protein HKX48_007221 [Thoreauomyces humboldtii]